MGKTYYTILQDMVQDRGAEVSLISPSGSMTFKQYLEGVDRLAVGLNKMGVKSGERV